MRKRHIPCQKGKGREECFLNPVSSGTCEAGTPTPVGVVTDRKKAPAMRVGRNRGNKYQCSPSPGPILSLPLANPNWHPESRPGAAAHGTWTPGAQRRVGRRQTELSSELFPLPGRKWQSWYWGKIFFFLQKQHS